MSNRHFVPFLFHILNPITHRFQWKKISMPIVWRITENLAPWTILVIYFLICLFRIYRYQHLYCVITIIAPRNCSKQLANGDKFAVYYPKLCRLLTGICFTKEHSHSLRTGCRTVSTRLWAANTVNTSFRMSFLMNLLFIVCMCTIVLIMLKSIIV